MSDNLVLVQRVAGAAEVRYSRLHTLVEMGAGLSGGGVVIHNLNGDDYQYQQHANLAIADGVMAMQRQIAATSSPPSGASHQRQLRIRWRHRQCR